MINITANIYFRVIFSAYTTLFFKLIRAFFFLRGCVPGDITVGTLREYSL